MKLHRKTKRLTIRPLRASDFNSWRQAHLTMSPPKNTWDRGPRSSSDLLRSSFREVLRNQVKRRAEDQFYDLAIFSKAGQLVGFVAAMDVARGISHTAFLGYTIYNNYWGHGYGKEAVRAMFDIGFRDLRLHRLEAGIEPGNTRSLRLAKSLGMRREGLKKRAIHLRGQWVDLVMYTVTTEDLGIGFDVSKVRWKPRS